MSSPDLMGNMMYFSFGMKEGFARFFWIYRIYIFYPYMIIITIFATRIEIDAPQIPDPYIRQYIMLETKTGLSILIYTWMAGLIWPYVLWYIIFTDVINKNTLDLAASLRWEAGKNYSTSRDLIGYINSKRYKEAEQLLRFGYVVKRDYMDEWVE